MSFELTLLLLKGKEELGSRFVRCYERLRFDQDYRIFGQLIDVSPYCQSGKSTISIRVNSLPPQMWVETYEDEGIKRTRKDPYGDELTFVYARQLKKLKLPRNSSPKNRAIKAFVDALPGDTPIILEWR